MTSAWHADYLRLENAAAGARAELVAAGRMLAHRRVPAGAQARYDAAVIAARAAGTARWDYEMAGVTVVNA